MKERKMKQKNTDIGKAFLCGSAAMLLLAGCVKESAINEKYRPAGTPITFSAATGYENGTGTRTEYSGQLYGNTPKYERIDWVADDLVTIVYAHGNGSPIISQYTVTEVSGDTDRNSTASVEVVSGQTKLTWGEGDGDHTFYAMYPSNGFGGNTSAILDGNHVTGSIPAGQTLRLKNGKYLPPMQYGYMVAYKNIVGTSTESRVTLPFTPAVTAFEFKLQKRNDDTGNLKVVRAELTATTPLTGTFAFDITGGDNDGAIWGNMTVNNGAGYTVSVSFPDGGVPVPEQGNAFLDFTLFALPVQQTGLQLKLIYTDGSSRILKLNDMPGNTPHVFAAAKKHIITNAAVPGSGFQYVLQHTGATITLDDGTVVQEVVREYDTAGATNTAPFDSYRISDGGTTQTVIPISLEYAEADADGLPMRDGTTGEILWSSTIPSELTSVDAPLADPGSGSLSAHVTEYSSPVVKETVYELLKRSENLKSRPAVGTSSAPYDLSMYDIHGTSRNNQPVTANCYVVDRAGWYMFPIVYGNAIDYTKAEASGTAATLYNNGVNAYAYKDAVTPSANEQRVWHGFQNFTGTSLISTPYILDDAGLVSSDVEAVVVWQDVESATYSFIENVAVTDVSSSNVFYDPAGSDYKTSLPYVKFQVPVGEIDPDETMNPLYRVTGIRQGNAVIAVRLKEDKTFGGTLYDAGTILWSWHIWITDGDDTDGDLMGDGLSSIPLGMYDTPTWNVMPVNLGWFNESEWTFYRDRIWYVRVSQTSGDREPLIFKVVQKKPSTSENGASGAFYQWGRKDPFLPSTGNANLNKAAYSPVGLSLTTSEREIVTAAPTVSNASLSIQNPNIMYHNPANHGWMLWATPNNLWDITQRGNQDNAVSKTVYDPCPPGYSVPRRYAFRGFTYRKFLGNWTWLTDYDDFRVADRNGDGTISAADYEYGWHFYTTNEKTATIYFPGAGHRDSDNGKISAIRDEDGSWYCGGRYWNAAPYVQAGECHYASYLDFYSYSINLWMPNDRSFGAVVRPVEEE